MHIWTKFDGGKQVNRSQAGSWQGRCAGAGLRWNEGAAWGPLSWEKATGGQPTATFEKVADTAKKLTDKDRKRKSEHAAKLQRKKARYSSNDNSLNARLAYSR